MTPPRFVLAFDTALNGCAAAVLDVAGNKVFADLRVMPNGQAEALLPMIDSILARADAAYTDVDLIGVTTGPGAFTGLRIGLATARALGLALGKPVVGITTFEVLERQARDSGIIGPLAIILETKRADFYVQLFPNCEPQAVSAKTALALLQAKSFTIIGDGALRLVSGTEFEGRYKAGFEHIDAGILTRVALENHLRGGEAPPEPVYLRAPDVTTSKKVLRTLAATSKRDA